jgi:mannosyltransferase
VKEHAWLIVILLVALAIRLPGMFQPLWYDESFTALVAALPWDRLWQATAGDVHPPLWYAIEKLMILVTGGSNSEPILRLPSLVLGLANVWLSCRVCRAIELPPSVTRITTLLMAILPGQIWYSNEARMYQLVQFSGLLATLGVYSRRWWLYGLGLALGLWSHNLFAAFAVMLLAVALVRLRLRGLPLAATWPRLRPVAVVSGLAGLSYMPWLAALAGQVGEVGNGFWVLPLNPGTPLYALHNLLWASTIPPWAGVHGVFISMLLILVGGWFTFKAGRWDLLVQALGAWGMLTIVSLAWRPVLIARTLMPCAPFICMLLAHGFAGRRRGPALAILAIPLLVVALVSYIGGETGRQEVVTPTVQPGDVVYHGNLASYILVSYYLPGVPNYVWPQANDLSQSLTRATKTAMGLHEADVADLQAKGIGRMWLYWSLNPTTSQAEYDYIMAVLDTFQHTEVRRLQYDRLIDARLYLVDLGRVVYDAHRSAQQ